MCRAAPWTSVCGRARRLAADLRVARCGLGWCWTGTQDLQAVDPLAAVGGLDLDLVEVVAALSPHDARQVEALFGQAWMIDESWSTDGRVTQRQVERPRVAIDEWMNALEPSDAWIRVAPIDQGWRQQRVRVAMPRSPMLGQPVRSLVSVIPWVTYAGHDRRAMTDDDMTEAEPGASDCSAYQPTGTVPIGVLPTVPLECPPDLRRRMGDDVSGKIEQRECPRRDRVSPGRVGG
jgi:hypothetical protein